MSSNPIPDPIKGPSPGPIKIPINPAPGLPCSDPTEPTQD